MKKSKFEKWQQQKFEERLSVHKHELEQKFRIDAPDPIRKKLFQMGAVKGAAGIEHNEVYDLDGRLKENNQTLRLRYHGKEGACLTFKGPRLKGHFKKRLELETPIQFESMKQILLMLGYRMVGNYRKHREEYILDVAKICLDHLPSVGWFCEIEGKATGIRATAKKLGLKPAQHENRSYRRLLKENLQPVPV